MSHNIFDYNFEKHFEFAKLWEQTNERKLFRISDWNADPKDVNIPDSIIQQAIKESLSTVTKYAETKLLVTACDEIQDNLENVYQIKFSENSQTHLFGNATQAIFGVLCGLKQIVSKPRILIVNPSYYSVKDSANIFEIPTFEMNRRMKENFRIDIDQIEELRYQKQINIIILTDPVYSCGSSITENHFNELIDYCKRNEIWLIVDNAFSCLSWINENKIWLDEMMIRKGEYKKAIVIDSPAKRLFTNNMKIGIVFADIELIKKLREFSDSHIGNISGLQVAFAKSIFSLDNKSTLENICKSNTTKAKKNFAEIEKLIEGSNRVSLLKPDTGFHCILKTPIKTIRQTNVMRVAEQLITEFSTLAIPTNDFFYDLEDDFGIRINLMISPSKSKYLFEKLSLKGFDL